MMDLLEVSDCLLPEFLSMSMIDIRLGGRRVEIKRGAGISAKSLATEKS